MNVEIGKHYVDGSGTVYKIHTDLTKNNNFWGKQVHPAPLPTTKRLAYRADGSRVVAGDPTRVNLVAEVRPGALGTWVPVPVIVPLYAPAPGISTMPAPTAPSTMAPPAVAPIAPAAGRVKAGSCSKDGHAWVDTGMRRTWCAREGCRAEAQWNPALMSFQGFLDTMDGVRMRSPR